MGILSMTSPVDRAKLELAKLIVARTQMESDDAKDVIRLAELRSEETDSELEFVINGVEPTELRLELHRLQEAIRKRVLVRPKLLDRIRAAVIAVAHAEADVIRSQAKKKEAALDKHLAKEAELRRALEEYEGCRYVRDLTPRDHAGMPMFGPLDGAAVRVPQSKTLALRAEIDQLLMQAEQIEANAKHGLRGGSVSGHSLAELLTAIADKPLAPTAAEVEAWFSAADREAAADFEREFPRSVFRAEAGLLNTSVGQVSRVTEFTMAWDLESRIDRAASHWANRANLQRETVAGIQKRQD